MKTIEEGQSQSDTTQKASRAQILKKAADYIEYMRRKHGSHQQDIDDLKKQNKLLESQIRALEKTKYTGNYAMSSSPGLNQANNEGLKYDGSASDTSDSESSPQQQNKKIKT